jgi:hypothetical protein
MEDYIKYQKFKDYIDTLDTEDKIKTALQFISDNPDCGTDVVQMAVEIQHA